MDAPGAPIDLVGREITVKLATPASVKPNDKIEFFTKGWLVGNSLAVIEVGALHRRKICRPLCGKSRPRTERSPTIPCNTNSRMLPLSSAEPLWPSGHQEFRTFPGNTTGVV